DTIAADSMRKRRARIVEFATLDEAVTALRGDRVEAVVHDRPLLRYRLKDDAEGLTLVGGAFNVQDYAIAFPLGSELRRPVSQALLRLREEEHQATYLALITQWLGEDR
ncbi:MAG: transporter substrate-binding domain-containing protein, partial [Planctomycetes bacterium]|nr:transporter substrate-binding domain-containing protein [Planctomycetota bacterium]